MSIGPPIPGIQLFQNLTLKIQGQGHKLGQSWKSQCGYNIQSTPIPFVPCQSGIPFLSCNLFQIWPWQSQVNVMEEVNIESHNMGPTFYRLASLSFHVNRESHSWGTTFSKFSDHTSKSQCGSKILSTHIPFVPCQSGTLFLSYDFFKIWPRKSRVKVMGEVTVQIHNMGPTFYRLTSL